MMKVYTADAADSGLRADVFIARQYQTFSRSSLEELFQQNLIRLDNKPIKGSYKIKPADRLEVDDALLFKKPASVELPILYEDDDVIVIDKPEAILTHSKGALNTESTVASFIKPMLSNDSPKSNRAGIVHRLDRATSGVIITAKTPEALHRLQKQFAARKVKKLYLAIVEGVPEPQRAVIDAPIARNPRKPQTFYVSPFGKPAQTEYRIIKTLDGANSSLLELRPQTGRTHQLRVHLAYIGHPIVGDRLYGRSGEHLYLQAKNLELTLPGGERKNFEAGLPNYFMERLSDV